MCLSSSQQWRHHAMRALGACISLLVWYVQYTPLPRLSGNYKKCALNAQTPMHLCLYRSSLISLSPSVSTCYGPDPMLSLDVQEWKSWSPLKRCRLICLFRLFRFQPLVPNSLLPNKPLAWKILKQNRVQFPNLCLCVHKELERDMQ